jgi:hypothetical protein
MQSLKKLLIRSTKAGLLCKTFVEFNLLFAFFFTDLKPWNQKFLQTLHDTANADCMKRVGDWVRCRMNCSLHTSLAKTGAGA